MSLKTEVGRIRHRLIRNKWIIPSNKVSRILAKCIKNKGLESYKRALDYLETTDYHVKYLNEITSKVTIFYLASLCNQMPELREQERETKQILDSIIKDILND